MTLKNFLFTMLLGLAATGLSMCSSEEATPQSPTGEAACHYQMQFHADCRQYDADTRAAVVWEDGARVFLTFSNGNRKVSGQATYKADTDRWDVYASESITSISGVCEAVYFDSPSSVTSAQATLSTSSVIYADTLASYELVEDLLIVHASLTPKTGRLRFKGNAGETFSVAGLS